LSARLKARFDGRLYISKSLPYFLELASPEVTKGAGLAFLAERLGFTAAETVAFADGENDVELLGWAGCAVAAANAHGKAPAVGAEVARAVAVDVVAVAVEAVGAAAVRVVAVAVLGDDRVGEVGDAGADAVAVVNPAGPRGSGGVPGDGGVQQVQHARVEDAA